jgi:hypothetical protein
MKNGPRCLHKTGEIIRQTFGYQRAQYARELDQIFRDA